MNLTAEDFKKLSEKEYYNEFANVLKNALWYNQKFYFWLIENMYEIFDRDENTLNEMADRFNKLKKEITVSDIFTESFYKYFDGTYSYGECTSLGCVANAFISWKTDNISKDEYYEIRDMFVPFNLPISFTVKSLQPILDIIKNDKENSFILLNRVGKAFAESNISDELIVSALDELNFNEED